MSATCEFCDGELDGKLRCKEADCAADMAVHWEMTNPDKLEKAIQVRKKQARVRDAAFFKWMRDESVLRVCG